MDANEQEKKQLQQMLIDTANKLSEHFESVRIFATRSAQDGESNTLSIDEGRGNWYAQYGQVHEWVAMMDEHQREHVRQSLKDSK